MLSCFHLEMGSPVTLRLLAPAMPRDAALRSCAQQARGGWLRRLMDRPAATAPQPHMELLWLPTWLIVFEVHSPATGMGTVQVGVDGCSGAFALSDVSGAEDAKGDEGEVLPLLIDEAQAQIIARKQLIRTILGQRGHRHKPTPGGILSTECVGWPVWTYYYPRFAGKRLDLCGCDALTGGPIGNRIRSGVLQGLVSLK
jgi:hypothetical protein